MARVVVDQIANLVCLAKLGQLGSCVNFLAETIAGRQNMLA